MELNRHNYEAFLLDLLEGRLSAEDQQRLNDFLLQNPDCSGDLMESEPLILGKEKIKYPGVEHLKRVLPTDASVLTEHNFDLFSIARMEGDLTRDQEAAHQVMVSMDEIRAGQWAQWQKTRLEAEPVLFKGKDQLKHKNGNRVRIVWMSLISAAAAVALLIFIMLNRPVIPGGEFAQQSTTTTEKQEGVESRGESGPEGSEATAEAQTKAEGSEATAEAQTKAEGSKATAEAQTKVEHPGPRVQNARLPVLNTIKIDHSPAAEPETITDTGLRDDLLPHPLKVSESQLAAVSLITGPVQDQINPLYIDPVPIHLNSLSVAQLSDMDLQELVEEYSKEKNFSLWNVASAGINGINRLTGSEISLLSYRDDNGEVSGFRLKSKRFSLSRPLGQE